MINWELADKSNAKYQPKILKLKNCIFMKSPKNPCKSSYFLGPETHPFIIIPAPQNSNGPWKCVCMISAWILTHPTLTTVPACASTFFGHVLMQMCTQLTRLWSFRMLGIDVSASNKIGVDFDNVSTWATFWSTLCPVPHQTSPSFRQVEPVPQGWCFL